MNIIFASPLVMSLADSIVAQCLESDDLTVLPILLNSKFETMCTASTFFKITITAPNQY